jgi:hypothetical protein
MIVRTFEAGLIAVVLSGCVADAANLMNPPAPQTSKQIAPSELKIAPANPKAPARKPKQSAQPPADASRTESQTPEGGAAARAADPKDPSGAIIIRVPGTGAGDKP